MLLGQPTAPGQHAAFVCAFNFFAQKVEEHHPKQVYACDTEEIFSPAVGDGKETEHTNKLVDEIGEIFLIRTGSRDSRWQSVVQAMSVDQRFKRILASFLQGSLVDYSQIYSLPLISYGIEDALLFAKLVPKDNGGNFFELLPPCSTELGLIIARDDGEQINVTIRVSLPFSKAASKKQPDNPWVAANDLTDFLDELLLPHGMISNRIGAILPCRCSNTEGGRRRLFHLQTVKTSRRNTSHEALSGAISSPPSR
ncbi:hypothetical protein [Rhizobium laguerreae]|nr:hypothetical protein [Rhizobium laguerreae]